MSERFERLYERARAGGAAAKESVTGAVRGAARPRRGAKRTLVQVIAQIPHYLRLLWGLMLDARVAALDKALVAAAIVYIITPFDFLPDFIPFLGEVDDVFLLMTALQRLIANAGRSVLLDHWPGERSELRDLNVQRVLSAAAFFLPGRMKRRLRSIAR